MNRPTLKFLAVLLSTLIVIVLFSGLDDLPRNVRAQIGAERRELALAQSQVRSAQDEVARGLQTEAALFRAVPASGQWPAQLGQAAGGMQSAARDMDELSRLEKANRRGDRQRVESLLAEERRLRAAAVRQAQDVRQDAGHWVSLKQNLPQTLQAMERNYGAIHNFDFAALAAAVQKAGTDWPEKKTDLESRLAGTRALVTESDKLWQSTAEARRAAASGDFSGIAAVDTAANSLRASATGLPASAEELKSLSAQLYVAWDKVLVDMEERGIGTAREYDQQIRTVRTQLADASAKTGKTTSDEKWVDVSRAKFVAMKNDLGMAIEHKPAGKFDIEAERVAQPAGFAYMAPPSQGSNQYGYWDHRDGRDFWVFYGQYALMRDLLFNHDYRPLDRREFEDYRSSQRGGQTYYGRDEAAGTPKYGSQGTSTSTRYSGSTYSRSGGFKDSQYASKSGGYRDSKYGSPAVRDPNADHTPRSFGRSRTPDVTPPRSYSPAPRPSFRMPSRSPGRSFGRRH